MARRSYAGAAKEATLASNISASTLSIPAQAGDLAGWASLGGVNGKFGVVIDRDQPNEEKIFGASISGDTIIVESVGDRGADGTAATSHAAGAKIEHVLFAQDVDESNRHINNVTLDEHTQYMKTDGTRHDLQARHGSSVIADGAITTAKLATQAVTTPKIAPDAVTSTEIAASAVGSSELATDSVTNPKIANLAVDTAEIAADAITNPKIADDAVAGENVTAFAEAIDVAIPDFNLEASGDITSFSIPSRPYRRVGYFTANINIESDLANTGDFMFEFRSAAGGAGAQLGNIRARESTFLADQGTDARDCISFAGVITVAAGVAGTVHLRLNETQGSIGLKANTSPTLDPGDIVGIIVPIGAT